MIKTAALKSVGASALAVAVLFTASAFLSANAAEITDVSQSDPITDQPFTKGLHFRHPVKLMAEELGISQEEFEAAKNDPAFREEIRAKMEELRQEHMQARADELGITINELKTKREARLQEHLQLRANELGISVDELLQNRLEKGVGMKIHNGGAKPFRRFNR
ncbi:hypothetical protein KJ758_03790 [Patescibacteria group bacterium]|nr:hypothetical protein [Patescibacteria group bacterium]